MGKTQAAPPNIDYEESETMDSKAVAEAFNYLFDRFLAIRGQSP